MTRIAATTARTSLPAALHVFRPGMHTTMAGQALEFSASDLAATCAAYDPAKHEAPLVVGHPRHDLPAYGWVAALKFSEGGIDATPAQVNPDFADMVAAGAFKKISASFYHPDAPQNPSPGVYYLRHVGFLGAQAPSVKGLRNPTFPTFADSEEGVISFEEFSPTPVPPVKESTVTEEEAAQLRTQGERQAARIAELEAAAVAAAHATAHAANLAFCEGVAGLPPAHRDVAVAMLDQLQAQATPVDFGEGEDARPLADKFKELLTSLKPAVDFAEHATQGRAAGGAGRAHTVEFATPPGYAAHATQLGELGRARAYMAAHAGIDLVAAVNAVRAGQA